jgi:hypothetical protein
LDAVEHGPKGYSTGSRSRIYRISHNDRIVPGTVRLFFIKADWPCVHNTQNSVPNMKMVHVRADTKRRIYGLWLQLAATAVLWLR